MTNTEINIDDDDAIRQSRVWSGKAMKGTWEGEGRWHLGDKTWKGLGTWQGGLLSGTWSGKGNCEGDGKGNWKGSGDLICSMTFKKYGALTLAMKGLVAVAVIGLVLVAAIGLISNRVIVDHFVIGGWFVVILLLILASIIIGRQETANGKWWGEGTWEDVGEFRILDMISKWKLGDHEGTLRGKMKDRKLR